MTMEHEPTGIINWIAKLSRNIASGRIVPIYYGDNVPPPMADYVKDAQALWVILLADSKFDIDGLFANSAATKIVFPLRCTIRDESCSRVRCTTSWIVKRRPT